MSYKSCIADLISTNKISQDFGDRISNLYQENPNDFLRVMKEQSDIDKVNFSNSTKRMKKQYDLEASIAPDNAFQQISELITKGRGGPSKNKGNNIEYRIKQVHAKVMIPLAKHLNVLRSKAGGIVVNKKLIDNLSSAIMNKVSHSEPQVNSIVTAMKQTLTDMNKLADSAGVKGIINDLADIAPLSNKIQGYSKQEFVDIMTPLVKDSQKDLEQVYKRAIEGEEIAKMSFKNGDALAEYQKKIGAGDPFSNLINYIDRMTASVSSAEVLGVNGKATIRNLARKHNLSDTETHQLTNMYEHATGTITTKVPEGISGLVANVISGLRAIGTATMMGAAVITSLLDVGTMAMVARYNGLPIMTMYGKMIQNLVSRESRMEMAQLGFQLESVMSSLAQISRFSPHASSSNTLNQISTGVLRVSGLLATSDAMKLAVKNTFLVTFKDVEKHAFKDILQANPKFYKQMKEYGINEQDWKTIQKSMKDDFRLDPSVLDDSVGSKVYRMVNEEADHAIVTPGARSAYWTSFGQDKGTVAGEIVKSMTQFKSTVVEQVFTHLFRGMQQQGVHNKVAYMAQYTAITIILGGMVAQLKEVTKNNTPVDYEKNPKAFISMAIKEGGTVPILNDIVAHLIDPKWYDDPTNVANMAALSRPIQIIENTYDTLTTDDKAKHMSKLVQNIEKMIPGTNIWYAKAFNAYLTSSLGYAISPKEERAKQKGINKRRKEQGQKQIIQM